MTSSQRRWRRALVLGLIVAAACGGAAWRLIPLRYEASALLHVAATQPTVLGDAPRDDYAVYKRAQITLHRDPFVIEAALRDPEISKLSLIREHSDDPAGWLAEQLILDYPGDATYLRIALRGDRPEEIAKIVNAVKDAYLREGFSRELQQRVKERDILLGGLQSNQAKIAEVRRAIYAKSKELGITSSRAGELKRNIELDQIGNLLKARARTLSDIRELEMQLNMLEAAAQPGSEPRPVNLLIEREINSDPQITRMEEKLAQFKESEYENALRTVDVNSPTLKTLRTQIAKLEEAIDERKAELRPRLVYLSDDPSQSIEAAKLRLAVMKKNLERDAKELEKIVGNVDKFDKYAGDIASLQADLRSLERVTSQMDEKLKIWEVNKDLPPRVTEVRPASVPTGNDAFRKYVAVAIAGIIGFGAVMFVTLLIELGARFSTDSSSGKG